MSSNRAVSVCSRRTRHAARSRFVRICIARSVALAGLVVVAVGLVHPAHGTGIQLCAWRAMTGLECPGCGLSRSVSCAVRGEFEASFAYHPFGIVLLSAFATSMLVHVLPGPWRRRILRHLVRRSGGVQRLYVGAVALFITYGVARIVGAALSVH
jgi:hypothetical protein